MDFSRKIFVEEAVQLIVATRGGVTMRELEDMPFKRYEMVFDAVKRAVERTDAE